MNSALNKNGRGEIEMNSALNKNGSDNVPKDGPPPEQSRPTQAELDAEAKNRARGSRPTAGVAPGAVLSSQPAPAGKGARRAPANDSRAATSAAEASRLAVERNMEDRDALAKRRAAARGGHATTFGAVTARYDEEAPPPTAPAVRPAQEASEGDESEDSQDSKPPAKSTAALEEAPSDSNFPEYTPASVAMAATVRAPAADAQLERFHAPGAEEAFGDEAYEIDKEFDESQKEGVEVSPEAAVTLAGADYAEVVEEAPVMYPGVDPAMLGDFVDNEILAFVADTVVDATGVAVVMSEEEEDKFEQNRRRRYLCLGAFVLIIVAISIVVPVVLLVGGEETVVTIELSPSIAPSQGPTPAPSAAPTSSAFNSILEELKKLPYTKEGVFEDRTSPQFKAANWLAEDPWKETAGLDWSDPKMLQRYAAATFYYATSGHDWKLCGKNSPSCGDTPWLADADECGWFSVSCEEGDGVTITQINFPATGNDLIGDVPPEMSLFTGIKRFLAPANSLQGNLDVAFLGATQLQTVAVPENRLEGTIPRGILMNNRDLGFLDLSGNQFEGPIPTEIGSVTKLSDLQLGGNRISGIIPSEIGKLALLANLEVHTNDLAGPIPDELYDLTKLVNVHMQENKGINGTISPSIRKLTDLTILQLGFTGLQGVIPEEIFGLTSLSEMVLEGASFSGTIPESFRRLNASLMDLLLNENKFSGPIPAAFDYLTALETLQLQGNDLTGSISAAVCAERGLRFQQLATLIVDCVITCDCCDNCEN